MKDYFKLLHMDSSALSTDEIQMVNDWYNKHKTGDKSISLRSPKTQEEYNTFSCKYRSLLIDICILWEDEESNYAGICTDGMMKGKIVFISHESLCPIPVFRTLSNFLKAIENDKITDLYPPQLEYLSPTDNPFDYPSKNRTPVEQEQDGLIADKLWRDAIGEKDDNKTNKLLSFIQIALPEQISQLKRYLFDSEFVYYILGIYKFYDYREDVDLLLQIGKENKQYRRLLKELGATPKKILWIEKW